MTTIYSYLKKDHETVATLFEAIVSTRSEAKRESLFLEVKLELILHADAEHATFYKALKKYPETKELIPHADKEHKEHKEVKEYLDKLSEISSQTNEWLVLLGELKHSVEHHVKEEETKMFPEAKKVLSKEIEVELVKKMEEFKAKLLEQLN